jgi:Poly(R)-hydroxyalkanoic acid synthase subunit (PHA_synth_III_E)
MSKGPNSKNPASAAGSGEAASSAVPWQPFGAAWGTSLDIWSAWADTWQSMLQKRGGPAAEAMQKALFNPGAWSEGVAPLMDELQDVFALPHFADLPRLDGSALPSPGPLVELMMVAQQYLLTAAPVWVQACQRFQAEVAERRQAGEKLDSSGEAMDLWNNVLDRTLMEFNRSEDFAKVQQRFLHAAMRQRREVRKTAERAAKAVDLPTRTEMTDVYQRLHDLTREVHGLRRELRALRPTDEAEAARPGEAAVGAAQKPGAARRKAS